MKTIVRLLFIALAMLATASLTEAATVSSGSLLHSLTHSHDGEVEAAQEEEGEQEGQEEDAPEVQDDGNVFDPASLPAIDVTTTAEQEAALRLVEDILEEQQLLLSGQNFVYQAGGRRDPFRSLLIQRQREISAPELRPAGLPGFLINEVQVTAIAAFQGRYQAMVLGTDGRTYFVEVGATLYDGRIVQITGDQVIFEQDVEDLMGARSTRQVIKRMDTENQGSDR